MQAELAHLRSRNAELETALAAATTANSPPAPPKLLSLGAISPLSFTATAYPACLEQLLADAPVGMAVIDRGLHYQYVNPALAALNGLEPADYPGRTIREVFPLIAPELEARINHVLASGQPLLDEEMIPSFPIGPNAPDTWKASYFPVYGGGGALVGVGVMVIPGATPLVSHLSHSLRNTERALVEREQINATLERRVAERTYALEQALAELRASETKYRVLFQTLPVGVLVADDTGQYVEYNQVARDLLGLEADNRQVRCAAELSHRMIDSDGNFIPLSAYPSIRGAYSHESFRDLEVGIVAPDRPEPLAWVSAHAAPLDLPHHGAVIVLSDITERRQATEELLRAKEAAEAADRVKSTFLAHISHEIRTPLTAVIGMTSLLRDTNLSAIQRDYAATIHTGAETLMTIIGNILDFSKIEAGQMELSNQPFDPRACLKDALNLVSHQARRKGLALDEVIDAGVPAVLVGDAARLRQVLVNLLSNAVKFTERGRVTLMLGGRPLSDADYDLVLSISDTGIGVAADRLEQIFDPFVQADSTTTRRFGGTGLGLAISKQLVELMGGGINVTSTPGEGSTRSEER
ncbi:MAG: PAS domain-containing protein, partial [Oscillochloris sp.]|nr:PAS domain-containing protein [Oscillochloris sp.]